jgi:hypothetical protein
MSVERAAALLKRPRGFLVLGLVAAAAAGGVALLSVSNEAGAQDTYAAYPVLNDAGPSGITTVSSESQAQTANGPIWGAGVGGVEIASAREAEVNVAGQRVWVAKAVNGGICVLDLLEKLGRKGPASSCASSSQLNRGATIEQFGPGHETFLAGVVPSGVPSVSIVSTDATTTTVATNDNAYAIEASAPIESVSFASADGTQQVKIGGA